MPANQKMFWVQTDGQSPTLRKSRVGLGIVAALLAYFLGQSILTWTLGVPFRLGIVATPIIAFCAGLSWVIELERLKLADVASRPRFGLAFCFIQTTLAALFFGCVAHEISFTSKGHLRNVALTKELEAFIGSGSVSIAGLDGKHIACEVSRTNFSDSDLIELIARTRHWTSGRSELSFLVIEKTSVTSVGIRALSDCKELSFLALPSVPLTDESIRSISSCIDLRYLSVDEKRLSISQLDVLKKHLPKLKLNGKAF